ncbi:hypothetical protein ACFO0A_05400 [Novosphingobium tardum]|uniref:Uncharacterized protein n=1 Tax=Novosphingobium tardum TaxID=1538021 RepID=A0ABV8RM79_9SPHN
MPIGPSTTTDPYLLALEPNVSFTSILTVGDALPGSTTGIFAGIPDGIGAFDNGDGTVTVIVNHELGGIAGVLRDHGSIGSFIDRIVIDKATLAVLSGDDAIKSLNVWNDAADAYAPGTLAFSRFCSGDLAQPTAFLNPASGLGTEARIYLTGEESGVEGRAVATIISGEHAGTAYELPFLGNMSFENLTANPLAQDKTIVAMTDDGTGGQVYIYVGDKQAGGSEIEQAGLSGGAFYGIKVAGMSAETNGTAVSGSFTLDQLGPNGNVSDLTGAQIEAESVSEGVTTFLRPEDSAWDPDNPNVLYFTTTNSFTGNSRLYQATFTDIAHPELGGTIVAVLDGSEGQKMFDNITVADGKVILQEDPGNQSYIARVWEYDIAHDTLNAISTFDPAQFAPGSAGFITQDEESSGVIDVTSIFGTADIRAYLLDAQVHAATGDPATVEKGQLLLMKVESPHDGGNGDDAVNGDATANSLSGNNGNDTVRGGSGNDVLHGNNGNDALFGMADNDSLYGDNGDDTLNGGAGNDLLVGGRGVDILIGGDGADVFDFSGLGFGDDTITDLQSGLDSLVFADGVGVRNETHGDVNGDGKTDTVLQMSKGGSVTLLGVADYDGGAAASHASGAGALFHDVAGHDTALLLQQMHLAIA